MQAEIITIGTELLLGEIVDTNSAWIAQQLAYVGLDVYRTVTVGDNLDRIGNAVRDGLANADLVITTGGLGPTVDDMTREGIARATGRAIVLDEGLLEEIAAFFAGRGRVMTDSNRKQATIPAGAEVIRNPVGTAPAFAVEHQGHADPRAHGDEDEILTSNCGAESAFAQGVQAQVVDLRSLVVLLPHPPRLTERRPRTTPAAAQPRTKSNGLWPIHMRALSFPFPAASGGEAAGGSKVVIDSSPGGPVSVQPVLPVSVGTKQPPRDV